jgi:enoyl-CoA hydratase
MGLNYEKEGHIAKVGLNRPNEKNALDPQILMDLHQTWQDINRDDQIRVVILYSCLPDIFCSGMDLRTAIPILTGVRAPETEAEKWLAGFGPHVPEAMLKPNIVKKPVIAAVNGYCLTGVRDDHGSRPASGFGRRGLPDAGSEPRDHAHGRL